MVSMFGGDQKKEVQPVARMADPESPELRERRRKLAMETAARGGRRSTIMSEAATAPRAPEYSSEKLGAE